jgi:L-2-hydroxyglutarate oxidase LhgO
VSGPTGFVIGAGVVGLAIAAALARRGCAPIVLEREATIGTGISSRNSEVIHGGMYYPTGSLRAALCVEGRHMLYAYAQARGVATRRLGKLIVATDDAERRKIEAIHRQGQTNGVEDLALIDGASARRLEPALACIAALHSPQTGIVDSHGLMLALQGEIEDGGGMIAFNTPVERVTRETGGLVVYAAGETYAADVVVNAAGLGAQAVARLVEPMPVELIPPLVLAKGHYFGFAGRPVFSRLIYPAPVDGGLGVHVTLDLAGRMRFGPDVEWIDREDYAVDPRRASAFEAAIRRYWPSLPSDSLVPDYAGIRPKLTGPGEPAADFMIQMEAEHGVPGLVNLFGIESPGLTASLAIAERVGDTLTA